MTFWSHDHYIYIFLSSCKSDNFYSQNRNTLWKVVTNDGQRFDKSNPSGTRPMLSRMIVLQSMHWKPSYLTLLWLTENPPIWLVCDSLRVLLPCRGRDMELVCTHVHTAIHPPLSCTGTQPSSAIYCIYKDAKSMRWAWLASAGPTWCP